jgi:hypothetical protein
LGVVACDARDHADGSRHGVGRVESATHPDLEHHHVAAMIPKRLDSEQCGELEERDLGCTVARCGVEEFEQLLDAPRGLSLAERPAVNAHALHVAMQVRRREEPRAQTRGA